MTTLTITTADVATKIENVTAAAMPPISAGVNPAKVKIKYETLNTHLSLSLLHSYVVDLIKCAEAAVFPYTSPIVSCTVEPVYRGHCTRQLPVSYLGSLGCLSA